MGNIIELLRQHAYTRRKNQIKIAEENLNHTTLNQELTKFDDVERKSQSKSSIECSEFYMACRENKIKEVEKLMKRMDLNEIDRIEPNGSTALHVSCYHDHCEIVKMLLEARADRAIFNKYNYLPFDEALNDKVKELFFRVPNPNRLVSNTGNIEWDLIDDDVLDYAAQERQTIKSTYENTTGTISIEKMFEKIEKNYIGKGLTHFDGIDNIRRFFKHASKEQDPEWIIKAYTAETDFYKILNQEIANGATQYQSERRFIIALFCFHPKLDALSYTGLSYRVIKMNYDDLSKYQINTTLMTTSFLSSSIDRKIAELFLYQKETQTSNSVEPRMKANRL